MLATAPAWAHGLSAGIAEAQLRGQTLTGRSSQVVEGKEPDSNESAPSENQPGGSSTETGVTVSHFTDLAAAQPLPADANAVAVSLTEALSAWLLEPDVASLRSRLVELLRRVDAGSSRES